MAKYNLNISLHSFTDEAPHLNTTDALVLDYLRDICVSQNPKIVAKRIKKDNFEWTWVNYSHLLKEVPILNIKSRSSISRIVKRLEEAGFIVHTKENGRNLYFRLLEKVDKLYFKYDDRSSNETDRFTGKTDRSSNETDCSSDETYHSINNNSNNNQNYIRPIFELYKMRINKNTKYTKQAEDKIKTRLKTYTPQELAKAIKRFSRNRWRMNNNADKGMQWFFKNEEQISTFLSLKIDIPLSEIQNDE